MNVGSSKTFKALFLKHHKMISSNSSLLHHEYLWKYITRCEKRKMTTNKPNFPSLGLKIILSLPNSFTSFLATSIVPSGLLSSIMITFKKMVFFKFGKIQNCEKFFETCKRHFRTKSIHKKISTS